MIRQSSEDGTPKNNNVWLGAKDALAKVDKEWSKEEGILGELGQGREKSRRRMQQCQEGKRWSVTLGGALLV